MRFGKTLRNSIYPPWREHYIDYQKLKALLREHEAVTDSAGGNDEDEDVQTSKWTEQDEETFMQELINVQLEKVHKFQVETYKQLRDRTSECEAKLEPVALRPEASRLQVDDKRKAIAQETLKMLDDIAKDVSELEKFSRINFSGFLKAGKKHDRKRGTRYRVKPLLQVRLSQLPFNNEDYNPLLYRLSTMYSFIRETLTQGPSPQPGESPSVDQGRDMYNSYKFWVHPDNLVEVKMFILRRLPVLVYNPKSSSKELDMAQGDPTITSLYFDTPKFDLYSQKVDRALEAGSLRLRWSGQLNDKPEIFLEKKVITEGNKSKEVRVMIKEKHIKSFLSGDYKMERTIHKMEDQVGGNPERVDMLKRDVDEIQTFIRENSLKPVVRANYTRTAFQVPGDDRIRISLDTDLAVIREDSLDSENPCRQPTEWHRTDIDSREWEFPFSGIPPQEIFRFPHAILDIKIRETGRKRGREWVADLMSSHLVKEAPRFSKFVLGIAQLFEDNVNSFPFWLNDLDTDIRRDPETAFHQEQERLARRAEDESAVGSYLGSRHSPSVRPLYGSPITRLMSGESTPPTRPQAVIGPFPSPQPITTLKPRPVRDAAAVEPLPPAAATSTTSPLRSIFSRSRLFLGRRPSSSPLPPGVRHPGIWIKDTGPVRVEAKVWLANQRTFIKWQHISVLLASLSLGLFNAVPNDNNIAHTLAMVYMGFAAFASVWGWWMYVTRSRLIQKRSGRDFDNVVGPLVVCLGLSVALLLNFWFKYAATVWNGDTSPGLNPPVPSNSSSPDISMMDKSKAEGAWKLVNQAGW